MQTHTRQRSALSFLVHSSVRVARMILLQESNARDFSVAAPDLTTVWRWNSSTAF